MHAYFTSPIGYIFVAVLLALSGVIFSFTTVWVRTTSTSLYFTVMLFMFAVLIPILTMKLFAEERKAKTEQILLTAPVSIFGIVFAKFLAAFCLYAGTFLCSCLINFSALRAISGKSLDFAQISGNIVGIILLGAAFIAVGVFMSSLTENQVISAVTTFAVVLFMLLVWLLPSFINNTVLRVVVRWFSVIDRFLPFTNGIFPLTSVVYFVSLAVVFLFLTMRVYEMRRWN
jgi:ABC-2 type transport system permease protein